MRRSLTPFCIRNNDRGGGGRHKTPGVDSRPGGSRHNPPWRDVTLQELPHSGLILGVIVAVTVRSLISTSPTAKIDTEISPPRYSQTPSTLGLSWFGKPDESGVCWSHYCHQSPGGMSILPICNLSASSRGEATEKMGVSAIAPLCQVLQITN